MYQNNFMQSDPSPLRQSYSGGGFNSNSPGNFNSQGRYSSQNMSPFSGPIKRKQPANDGGLLPRKRPAFSNNEFSNAPSSDYYNEPPMNNSYKQQSFQNSTEDIYDRFPQGNDRQMARPRPQPMATQYRDNGVESFSGNSRAPALMDEPMAMRRIPDLMDEPMPRYDDYMDGPRRRPLEFRDEGPRGFRDEGPRGFRDDGPRRFRDDSPHDFRGGEPRRFIPDLMDDDFPMRRFGGSPRRMPMSAGRDRGRSMRPQGKVNSPASRPKPAKSIGQLVEPAGVITDPVGKFNKYVNATSTNNPKKKKPTEKKNVSKKAEDAKAADKKKPAEGGSKEEKPADDGAKKKVENGNEKLSKFVVTIQQGKDGHSVKEARLNDVKNGVSLVHCTVCLASTPKTFDSMNAFKDHFRSMHSNHLEKKIREYVFKASNCIRLLNSIPNKPGSKPGINRIYCNLCGVANNDAFKHKNSIVHQVNLYNQNLINNKIAAYSYDDFMNIKRIKPVQNGNNKKTKETTEEAGNVEAIEESLDATIEATDEVDEEPLTEVEESALLDETDADEGKDATDADDGKDATDADDGKDATDADDGKDATDADDGKDATDADDGKDATDAPEDDQ